MNNNPVASMHPDLIRAFLIFTLCRHCIKMASNETIATINKSSARFNANDTLDSFLLDKEISKYFLYWSTELVWSYSKTPEIADKINPIIISLFEENFPVKFNEVQEYSDIPKKSSAIVEKFGLNVGNLFDLCCAITTYKLNMQINTNLKALIPSITKILNDSDDAILEMVAS